MGKVNTDWLPHLAPEKIEEVSGYQLDAYLMALEGWRRGLTLRWHVKDSEKFKEIRTWFVEKPGHLFSLSSKDKTHYFFKTRGDLITNEAVDICSDKFMAKNQLKEKGVRVPDGKSLAHTTPDEEILETAQQIGYPVVVKPLDGSYGRDVYTNLQTDEEVIEAVQHIRESDRSENILIEEYVPGNEFRIYVVGDQVAGAMQREPANIIGDGEKTIQQLIDEKNEQKKQNPRLISCQIELTDTVMKNIQKHGYELDSVLEKDKKLYLLEISNISRGGDPISMTDELPDVIKETAVKAIQAIPGLTHGAVDLIIDESGQGIVLELNPTAQIGGLVFPMYGKPNDIPAAIIDYYFPETKDLERIDENKIYFGLETILEPLYSRTSKTVTTTPIPRGKIHSKKFIVKGDVQQHGYHLGLRKQLFERHLHGRIVLLEDESIEIIAAGTDPEMIDEFKQTIYEDPERSDVQEVIEYPYDDPFEIGVEIKTTKSMQQAKVKELQESLEILNNELYKLEKKLINYKNSASWKLSFPIRIVGAITKKFRRRPQN